MQVGPVDEQRPHPTMGLDMVDLRRRRPQLTLGTFAAEGLQQELCGTQVIPPDRQQVQFVPLRALTASAVFRLVSMAPTVSG